MTADKARQLAHSAYCEAKVACDGDLACMTGYLREAIVSLLVEHCQPERVTMATGLMDVVYLDDVPVGVVGTYIKGCPATDTDPGQEPTFEVQDVYLMGYRLPDEIAKPLADHYRASIDERMADLHDTPGEPCPEWEVWE